MNKKPFEKYFILSPYIWLVLFFFIPLAIIFKISISVSEWGMPPYQDIFVNNDGFKINITLENYFYILSDFYYIRSFLNSIVLAFISTFFLYTYWLSACLLYCYIRHKIKKYFINSCYHSILVVIFIESLCMENYFTK